jgi:ubiquitin-conjugating enzyme E2 D/E
MSVYSRLQNELDFFMRSPPENCSAGPAADGNPLHWEAFVIGPVGTPYEGGFFKFDINFPREYPAKAPLLVCRTQIYHFNFWPDGRVCVDTLSGWVPTMNVHGLLVTVCALMACPNPNSPTRSDLANIYKNDRAAFEANARNHTRIYAQYQP